MNRVALGLVLYCLALPLLLLHFREYVPPPFRTCASLRIFGCPCSMCGLTRGMSALLQGDLQTAWLMNPLTLPVAVLAALEIAYRLYALFSDFKSDRLASVIRWDLRVHISLAGFYVTYSGLFLLRQCF